MVKSDHFFLSKNYTQMITIPSKSVPRTTHLFYQPRLDARFGEQVVLILGY
jgi:hypothetical protein